MKIATVRWKITLLCVLFLSAATGHGQSKNELVRRKEDALREISLTNELLKRTERNRKTSLNELILLNRKLSLRNNLKRTKN